MSWLLDWTRKTLEDMRATLAFCWPEKLVALIVFWVMAGTTYIFIPRVLLFQAETTPFHQLDRIIPFLSWTIVIYLTLYPQVILIFFSTRNRLVLRNLFWAYMIGGLLLSFFYFFLPTTHNYPPPVTHCRSWFDGWALWLRATDVAANQFPSGHAFFSLLGPFLLLSAGRYRKAIPFLIWGVLISASTLTVKQHNLIDMVAGGLFAWAFGYMFGMSCPKKD